MQTTSRTFLTVLLYTSMHLQLGSCIQNQDIFLYNNHHRRSIEAEKGTEPELMLLEVNDEEDAIPLRFYKELDSVNSLKEFYERVDNTTQFGFKVNRKRSVPGSVVTAQPAHCMLDPVKVELEPLNRSADPKVYYFPKCTRVNRCSGCCNSDRMSCEAIETETINFEVQVLKYVNEWKSDPLGKEIIPVEQHNKCACNCRIKSEHCNSPNHVYSPESCLCSCGNISERRECLSRENAFWNNKMCKCECNVTIDDEPCTSGTIYDHSKCECIKVSKEDGLWKKFLGWFGLA